jgi:hypothetical protein
MVAIDQITFADDGPFRSVDAIWLKYMIKTACFILAFSCPAKWIDGEFSL